MHWCKLLKCYLLTYPMVFRCNRYLKNILILSMTVLQSNPILVFLETLDLVMHGKIFLVLKRSLTHLLIILFVNLGTIAIDKYIYYFMCILYFSYKISRFLIRFTLASKLNFKRFRNRNIYAPLNHWLYPLCSMLLLTICVYFCHLYNNIIDSA